MKRILATTFLAGMLISMAVTFAVGFGIGGDSRLRRCPGFETNTMLKAFEIDRASSIWRFLPAMKRAPELEEDDRPAFVAVFAGEFSLGLTGRAGVAAPRTLTGVVCVVQADGIPNLYSNVEFDGLKPPRA